MYLVSTKIEHDWRPRVRKLKLLVCSPRIGSINIDPRVPL
jgi:hypothetical protein